MKMLYALVLLFCILLVQAVTQDKKQETKPVAAISAEEEIGLLAAQKEQLTASQVLQTLLQRMPEYQRANDAQKKLQELASQVYSSRKITGEEYSLCDGPTLPECKDVAVGRIALRPVPKKFDDATKKPEKK
jgi:hypothetical protein